MLHFIKVFLHLLIHSSFIAMCHISFRGALNFELNPAAPSCSFICSEPVHDIIDLLHNLLLEKRRWTPILSDDTFYQRWRFSLIHVASSDEWSHMNYWGNILGSHDSTSRQNFSLLTRWLHMKQVLWQRNAPIITLLPSWPWDVFPLWCWHAESSLSIRVPLFI